MLQLLMVCQLQDHYQAYGLWNNVFSFKTPIQKW
jgi:hypothetical protein